MGELGYVRPVEGKDSERQESSIQPLCRFLPVQDFRLKSKEKENGREEG